MTATSKGKIWSVRSFKLLSLTMGAGLDISLQTYLDLESSFHQAKRTSELHLPCRPTRSLQPQLLLPWPHSISEAERIMQTRRRRRRFLSSASLWARAELLALHFDLDHAHRYPGPNLPCEKLKMLTRPLSDDHRSGRQSFRRMGWVLHGTRPVPRLANLDRACVREKARYRWM